MPPRVIGLYALALMEREGPVYGYQVGHRIADRTGGGWQPGAGAIYPALAGLVERGLAERSSEGRRRVFRITARGRASLRRLREGARGDGTSVPDLGALWSDILGGADPGPFLLRRLRRTIDGLDSYLADTAEPSGNAAAYRSQILAELRLAQSRFSSGARATRPRRALGGGVP
jgi:DNA-binding PadR family transcriptional regulator